MLTNVRRRTALHFVWQSITDASLDRCMMVSTPRRALLSTARDDNKMMSMQGGTSNAEEVRGLA